MQQLREIHLSILTNLSNDSVFVIVINISIPIIIKIAAIFLIHFITIIVIVVIVTVLDCLVKEWTTNQLRR